MKKKVAKKNNNFTIFEVVSLIIITSIVCLIMGSIITYSLNKNKFTKYDKNLAEFVNVYNKVKNNYYEEIDSKDLLNNAIKGMVNSLGDDYSYLIDEEETRNFDIQLQGNYQGIGVEIIKKDEKNIEIYNVFKNSPADKAGLKKGDIIKSIDGISFENKEASDISNYVKDNKSNKFKIIVIRDNEEKELTLTKELVEIKSVESKIIEKDNKKIGYLKIDIFSNTAYRQFKNELENLERSGIDALIIDVRDNSGGHLTTATSIISLFLNSKHIIYQTKEKNKIEKFYSTGSITKKYKIVVLQNELSASASEMLSSALKEEYGATVVGKKSYGKGTVQELFNLSSGSEYKITTKEWLTPKGNSINKKGVEPNVDVELEDNEDDNQLEKAIEEASK